MVWITNNTNSRNQLILEQEFIFIRIENDDSKNLKFNIKSLINL